MANIRCCKGCEDRKVGCHSTCEKYIKAKAENDSIQHQANLRQNVERYLKETRMEKRCKSIKKYGKPSI